ncbi:hypothetical protein ABPG75_007934 [Micractinium tetrahymenae]
MTRHVAGRRNAYGLSGVKLVFGDIVAVELEKPGRLNLKVAVGGKAVSPGTAKVLLSGTLRYDAVKPGQPRRIVIGKPGLLVVITQPVNAGKLGNWLNVWVQLTAVPNGVLAGALGSTFPGQAGSRKAAGGAAGGAASLTFSP